MGIFNDVNKFLGTDRSDDAIAAQQDAANKAQAFQAQAYEDQKKWEAPWQEAGVDALGKMRDPSFQRAFTMADFQADPGYQFRVDQGQKALERSAAARGLNLSGAQAKALTSFGQGMGAQEYQAAYDRFNNDNNLKFGRLATVAGYGQNANAILAGAAQNYGNNAANIAMGLGNAEGAANIASGNAAAQTIDQLVSGATMMFGKKAPSNGGGGASVY